MLKSPEWDKPFELFTDGSSTGIGAFLAQSGKPIAFCNRKLNYVERTLSATQIELLAITWATKKLWHYLRYSQFVVKTDHKPLPGITSKFDHPDKRIQCYLYHFRSYDFTFEYVLGKTHYTADLLSHAIDLRQQEPQTDADMIETSIVAAVTTRSQNRITNQKSPMHHHTNTPDNGHIKAKSLSRTHQAASSHKTPHP